MSCISNREMFEDPAVRQAMGNSSKSDSPSQTKKDLGYVGKAVVLTFGPSQIVGTISGVSAAIKTTVAFGKMVGQGIGILASRGELFAKKHLTHVDSRNALDHQQAIQTLENILSMDEVKLSHTLGKLGDNSKRFVASMLSLMPVVGLLAAGGALAIMQDTGKGEGASVTQRTAMAVSKNVFAALPGISDFMRYGALGLPGLYPMSGRESKTLYTMSLSELQNMLRETNEKKNLCLTSAELNGTREECITILKAHVPAEMGVQETAFSNIDQARVSERHIAVDRGDGKEHTVLCHFINGKNPHSNQIVENPGAKTMVLFHGNGMTGKNMATEAKFWSDKGFNVAVLTMGGYPGSDSGQKTTELSTIQDVKAVLNHLEAQGVKEIGLYGHSIGSTLAMHGSQLSPAVKAVICSKGLAKGTSVAANTAKNMRQAFAPLKLIPSALIRGMAARAFPEGRIVPGVKDKDGNPYQTDGLNNEKKAREFHGTFVAVGGIDDTIMGVPGGQKNFAKDLVQAYNEGNPGKEVQPIMVAGGHNTAVDYALLEQIAGQLGNFMP